MAHGTNLIPVEMLLEAGADLNTIIFQMRHGRLVACAQTPPQTALLIAMGTGSIVMVHLLIGHGALVNLPATKGFKRTPLQKASEVGSLEIVQLLLKHWADANGPATHTGGGTALQLAAIGGYLGIACLLLNHGTDVNGSPSTAHGRTALEDAAEYGRIDMADILLKAGPNIDGPHRPRYENAIRPATENGHHVVVEFLKSRAPTDRRIGTADGGFHNNVSVHRIFGF